MKCKPIDGYDMNDQKSYFEQHKIDETVYFILFLCIDVKINKINLC